MLTEEAVVLSHFSLRYATLEDRMAAAEAAGFRQIGLSVGSVIPSAGGPGPDFEALRRQAEDHGLRVAELEALRGWPADEEQKARAALMESTAFQMADALGSRYLQVIGPCPASLDEAATAFAALCDRAGDHGLTVGIEFLPFTNIADADAAAAVVRAAGRSNGGVCVDAWHHFRGAHDDRQLRALGASLIAAVQLDDGTMAPEDPDYYTDCLENRRLLGQGEFDLVGLVRLLNDMDVTVPVSLEVISTRLQAQSAEEVCRQLMQSWRDLLVAAR